LYEEFRHEDYSVWFFHYDKYEGEGIKLSHTSNLMNGFLQRCDPFRKHTLSVHAVMGEEPNLEIMGVWLFRGPEMLEDMKENPQFEYHKVRKMDIINNADDKKLFEEFVFGEEEKDKANGLVLQVKRFFK
jgi:elongation factor 1-gamma